MVHSINQFLRTVRVLYGLIKKENSHQKQMHFSMNLFHTANQGNFFLEIRTGMCTSDFGCEECKCIFNGITYCE